MKSNGPNKVFILENGNYIEISDEEHCKRKKLNKDYACKWFIPLHGMLMEVSETVYREFYREEERQKYIDNRSRLNGDVSYEWLVENGFHYTHLLATPKEAVEEMAEQSVMKSELYRVLVQLSEEEKQLICAVYVKGLSERQWSEECGVPQRKINRQKMRILKFLRKKLEKS